MERQDLQERLRGLRHELDAFGVESLSVFGSVARGEAAAASDVDLLVRFKGPADFERFMGLKLLLEDVLGTRVDLVTEKALRPGLEAVRREAVRVA